MPRLTDAQLAERRTFLGGSDIAAISGLSPWRDGCDVLNAKLGYSTEAPAAATDATEIGHLLEPIIRGLYVTDQNTTLIPCGTVRHATETWAAATLDAKIEGQSRGLEIKAVGGRAMYDWDPSDDEGIPEHVRAQVAWQQWVMGLDEVDVAALLGGTSFRVWRIARDVSLEALLVEAGRKFWTECVLGGAAPAITGSESVRVYLDAKYPPKPAPIMVNADANVTEMLELRTLRAAARDDADRLYREETAKVIAWLGEHNADTVLGVGVKATYRADKNGKRTLRVTRDK